MAGVDVSVLVVDDHEIVRHGIVDALNRERGVHVVGEAGSVHEALDVLSSINADVAVLDVRLPDGDGIELCREIRSHHPATRCLILTSFDDEAALAAAVVAGAAGYVLKGVRLHELVRHVRDVGAGHELISPELRVRARKRFAEMQMAQVQYEQLSPQERRILELITAGMTNREISEEMSLAEKTVRNYVSNLLMKLGMSHRTQVAAYGARLLAKDSPAAR
jgi:DNA-binding NarL/FixJ family response regulator